MDIPPDALRHFNIHAEIERQTDRGAALIAAAYLDERLQQALTAAFSDSIATTDVGDRLFGTSGPLSSLSAKIDIAFALGFFGPDSLRDLHLIRKIRNRFAHAADVADFHTPPVSDLCRALRLPEWVRETALSPDGDLVSMPPPTEPRERFLRSVGLLWRFLWTEMVKKNLVGDRRRSPPPTTLP